MSDYAALLAQCFPPVSYDTAAAGQTAQRQAEAEAYRRLQYHAERVLDACYAPAAAGYLPRWEQLLAITPPQPGNYARRVADVLAKLNATGGLSIPYFTALAAAAGYTIHISEPQPFRAGVNRAGHRLAREDIMWVWWVDVAANRQTVWRFRAGSSTAGSRLSDYSDAVIETMFNELKPAHTAIRFTYR
ncbi:YmfQ family protein [Neisseria shayeganii]|uniref:DUF2313 domain-containing protein n=1 Tax=Neisseria shayeganii TaxID=607712 RepID=A0A7D7SG69_9NEIS|nr:putative phage tail protein [Neisseria shayeganii]QMT40009.1 DUF2313 domain-containing protein [Neisseria shayeganii]